MPVHAPAGAGKNSKPRGSQVDIELYCSYILCKLGMYTVCACVCTVLYVRMYVATYACVHACVYSTHNVFHCKVIKHLQIF